MTLALNKRVFEFLSNNPDEKFTVGQISNWIFENYPQECREKQNRSQNKYILNAASDDERNGALKNALTAEIGARRPYIQKEFPQIKTTEGRPRKYYFTTRTDVEELRSAEGTVVDPIAPKPAANEHGLYPKLGEYLYAEFGLFSKRINEKRSKNANGAGGNKWLYPDMVAMQDLSAGWTPEIKACVDSFADRKCRLWSFEVKVMINRSNIREVFFQTVSNSSWANFAYLVASEIRGDDTMEELRMLSSLHGIGLITLDSNNPTDSEVTIPARERIDIDWNTANRLADQNADFLDIVGVVSRFNKTGHIEEAKWDN